MPVIGDSVVHDNSNGDDQKRKLEPSPAQKQSPFICLVVSNGR